MATIDTMAKTPAAAGYGAGRGRTRGAAALALLIVVAALAACSPAASTAVYRPATATPIIPRTPTVVFRADWSKGLAGWNASNGWSVHDDALESDSGTNRTLTIPYQPTAHDYALEYTMELLAPHDRGEFEVNAAPQSGRNGYEVHLSELLTPGHVVFASHPHFGITIDPYGAQEPVNSPFIDFEPGTRAHTYRIEVRGPTALVFVDNRRLSPGATSAQTSALSGGPLTFNCTLAGVRISELTISAL